MFSRKHEGESHTRSGPLGRTVRCYRGRHFETVRAELPDSTWSHYKGYCLKYFNDRLSWSDANKACAATFPKLTKPPALASVYDEDMNDFVFQLYSDGVTGIDTFSGKPDDPVCARSLFEELHRKTGYIHF